MEDVVCKVDFEKKNKILPGQFIFELHRAFQ